tara:strand:- start:219 stop:875 length:657 start_codon:yes stop_codon:yes gene_type:complete
MMKHVGRHGDKKVAVVFREVPGEDHMCLVVYPDSLKQSMHDDLMNAIQSDKGQNAKQLGDALHGITGSNGSGILGSLHREGFMQKVRTQDVIMTPTTNRQGVRLDEINKIIRDLDTGSEAAKKLAMMDATSGLADPDKRSAGILAAAAVASNANVGMGVLDDAAIAASLVAQAEGMKSQISILETEMTRLLAEAATLAPAAAVKKAPAKARKSKVVTA